MRIAPCSCLNPKPFNDYSVFFNKVIVRYSTIFYNRLKGPCIILIANDQCLINAQFLRFLQ